MEDYPLNYIEWQTARELLIEAKSVFMTPGEQHCIATALEVAMKSRGDTLVVLDYAKVALREVLGVPDVAALTDCTDPLDAPYWGRPFMYWLDKPGRTRMDVLTAFDAAADYAQNRKKIAAHRIQTFQTLSEYDDRMRARLSA